MCIFTNAHAATCAVGEYLDENNICVTCTRKIATTEGADISQNYNFYCPGDDTRHLCPIVTTSNPHYIYFQQYYINTSIDVITAAKYCRATFADVPIAHGITTYNCGVLNGEYIGGTNCQYKYNLTKCDAGYYANVTGKQPTSWNIQFANLNLLLAHDICIAAGFGFYVGANDVEHTACPAGTYTATDTAAAASDCMPCTNAPANAHYTAANTTDGTPNCEWECDDGFGHTSDDRCLPLCRIGETAMNGINIYAEKHTKYAMAVPRGGATCWISAEKGQGGKLVPVN